MISVNSVAEPLWAEIDLGALRKNFIAVKAHVTSAVNVMAVVKANAYGHGAVQVAQALSKEGAAAFGVARIAEAIELRNGGITQPVLIFGPTPPHHAPLLAQHNLTQTVHSDEYADALGTVLKAAGVSPSVSVHLKIDTGMGRLGYLATGNHGAVPLGKIYEGFKARPSLAVTGVYTHFAASDAEVPVTARRQLEIFTQALSELPERAREKLCIHAANSAGIMVLPDAHFDMVRAGIMLYGLNPSEEMDKAGFDLEPVMSLRARLSSVKNVPAGFTVSYGHTHTTGTPTIIGAVPVGYADGYPRLLSSKGEMLLHGRRASVVGRVCMDQTMIDVGHIQGVAEGDIVTIIGRQGTEAVTADEHARLTSTINYEVTSRLLARVPRFYVEDER